MLMGGTRMVSICALQTDEIAYYEQKLLGMHE